MVGYSGGLDSTVLLHWLARQTHIRARGLRAIHVHHGLQAQASNWADHCRDACAALNIALSIAHVHLDPASGDGLEATARRARYAAFAQHLAPGDILALAHHRDDQAETFLLRALRASSIDGLAAMQAWRTHGQGWLWRPLLNVPRADLLAYAHARRLSWIEDPSNADTAMDRNFLRHHIMPLLRQRWPHSEAALARSADLAAQAATTLLAQANSDLDAARHGAIVEKIEVMALRKLPPDRRARVLRRWVAGLDLPPLPATGIAAIEHELLHARSDKHACFAWRDARIVRWRDGLYAMRGTPDAFAQDWQALWDGTDRLLLPNGASLEVIGADGFGQDLHVRARRGGERLVLPGRAHSHALKHVLQERGIPPWERGALPLLFAEDGELLAAGDVIVSDRMQRWLGQRGARLRLMQC